MEELLKHMISEMAVLRNEMNNRFDGVDKRFNDVDARLGGMDKRFDDVDGRLNSMDKRFDDVDGRLNSMDKRFDDVDGRLNSIDKRFNDVDSRLIGMDKRFDKVDSRLGKIEEGQLEIKNLIKHHTALFSENFTDIRKEMRIQNQETKSDINLLFKEVETLKRKTNKIEQRLGL